MQTLWVPSGDSTRVRTGYRDALAALGWRAGAWRRRAVGDVRDGPTHVCLPTAAGVFLLPPDGIDALDALARALSQRLDAPVLALDDTAVWVVARGAVAAKSALPAGETSALSSALGVPDEAVRQLLDASIDAAPAGGAGGAERDAWELVALRVC